MNESLSTAADDQLLASATSAISQMDTVLTSLRNNYQQVNADMEVQCLSVANKTAVSTEQYADFEKAMCGDTAVGLGSSWFIQFIMFFALIPVVVLSLKGKIRGLAVFCAVSKLTTFTQFIVCI